MKLKRFKYLVTHDAPAWKRDIYGQVDAVDFDDALRQIKRLRPKVAIQSVIRCFKKGVLNPR